MQAPLKQNSTSFKTIFSSDERKDDSASTLLPIGNKTSN
jgi:hypothetical protein